MSRFTASTTPLIRLFTLRFKLNSYQPTTNLHLAVATAAIEAAGGKVLVRTGPEELLYQLPDHTKNPIEPDEEEWEFFDVEELML